MTSEIPRENWKMFFDDLTKRRFGWKTKVEVFNEIIGSQILDKGLPLNGITCEDDDGTAIIEIFIGIDDDNHQTHNIKNPARIIYFGEGKTPSGIVEIEEMDGTKTLVHIIQPMPIVVDYGGNSEAKSA